MIKNGKIFGKINIFDFIVIVLACLLVFATLMFFGMKVMNKNADGTVVKEMTYEIEINSVREETVKAFEVGQSVYGNTSKKQMGVITQIDYKDATQLFETLDGKLVDAPVEGKYDLKLKVQASVKTKPGDDLWLNSFDRLSEGTNITFTTQKNKCFGEIKNVIELTD